LRAESVKVNRKIRVRDFKNVDYFAPPPVRGHVTRRMRSDCFR